MIKYYKELEHPNENYLPLIKGYIEEYRRLYEAELPLSFFNKYSALFNTLNELQSFLKSYEFKKMFDEASKRTYFNNFGQIDYQKQYDHIESWSTLYKLVYEDFEETERIQSFVNPNYLDIEHILEFYMVALNCIYDMFKDFNSKFRSSLKEINKAKKDIAIHTYMELPEQSIAENVRLYNAWYLTPYGDLYNTGGKDGHQQTNLLYPRASIKEAIFSGEKIDKKQNLLKLRRQIISDGYVTDNVFTMYRNYEDPFVYLNTTGLNAREIHFKMIDFENYLKKMGISFKFENLQTDIFERRAYENRIVRTTLGVVSAQAGLYNFFENMLRYTKNPKEEYLKLLEMTKRDFNDILVRCAGFHKIETNLKKTITTSSINNFDELYEYFIRGFDVCFIPPIVVNREQGIICALDTDTAIIGKMIDNNIKKYEKNKQPGYGRLY